MKTTSVKGTKDYLPRETALRDYLQSQILATYQEQGFNRISTPIIEDIENLEKSDGGENLNLIFKILKRGDKLTSVIESKDYSNLADLGLRYDLTLPLSRFYAEHKYILPNPFKVIQIDKVYRAERPQKGRDREFVQCDIDILGTKSINAEIELIDITSSALLNLGLKNFTIKINDRRILKQTLLSCGFNQDDFDSVCITLDKMDKVGLNGVREELVSKNFSEKAIDKLCDVISKLPISVDDLNSICGELTEVEEMKKIISSVKRLAGGKYNIDFDLSLVRGQGYYTGPVFEIKIDGYSGSIGGGGRYDNLIGKFTGEDVPAVGFSIGFERLYSILSSQKFEIKTDKLKLAIIYDEDDFLKAMEFSKTVKDKYSVSLFACPKKLGKLLAMLEENDFSCYCVISESEEIKKLASKNS